MDDLGGGAFAWDRDETRVFGDSILVFDPCADMPSQEDFLSKMKTNIEALKTIYGDS